MTDPVTSAVQDGDPFKVGHLNDLRTDILSLTPGLLAHRKTGGYWHWSLPNVLQSDFGSRVFLANTIEACPIIVPEGVEITGLGFIVHSTPWGNAKARMGIYDSSTNLYPNNLVYSDTTELATFGGGTQVLTTTFSAVVLEAETVVYWIAVATDTQINIKYIARDTGGKTGILGTAALTTDPGEGLYGSWAYQSPPTSLPDPFPSTTGQLYTAAIAFQL